MKGFEHLPGHHRFVAALVLRHALVVITGNKVQSGITERIERQHGIVEINDSRVIAVDEIHRAVIKLVTIGLVGQRHFGGIPVPLPIVLAQGMALFIEILRVVSFPPQAFSVSLLETSVVHLATESTFLVSATRVSYQVQA